MSVTVVNPRHSTPFGGFKQSEFGRELGMHALDGYSEVTNVFVDHPAPAAPPDQPAVFGPPMPAKRVQRDARADEVRGTLEFIVDNDDRVPS